MERLKVFYLEDNPESVEVVGSLRKDGHDVILASNLNKAAEILQHKHDPVSFDKFFFDVLVPGGKVLYRRPQMEYKEYSDTGNINGLIFLLHNLNLLGEQTDLANRVAVITAIANHVKLMSKIDIFGTMFVQKHIIAKHEKIIAEKSLVPQIWYETGGQTYTFSLLDKVRNDIATQIRKFMGQ
jgi:CheY-like chemotaxis protein